MLNTKYNFTAEGTGVSIMRDSIQYPAIRIVYGGVCLLAVAASLHGLRFRAVPCPPLASPNCILFIIMHPLSRSVLSSPRRPLPSHIGIGHPILRGLGRLAMERKPIYRISHLDPRIRHARAALLRSPIKGYYDGAIGSPVVRLLIMMAMGSSWLVGGDPG